MGNKTENIGHIEGFSGVNAAYVQGGVNTFKHDPFTKQIEWVVKAKSGTDLTLTVKGVKAGSVTKTITL